MVQAFVSPLHDSDKKDDGSLKKSHFHVLMMYDGVKTPEQAREIFESFGGVGCEPMLWLSIVFSVIYAVTGIGTAKAKED